MSVMIEQIRFQNYRQYQSGVLHFDTTSEHKLTAFVAQNGTGKTTILNAMTWCLYGKEYQISDVSKALPIVNTKVLNASEGQVAVSVTICVSDENRSVEFTRTHSFDRRNPKIPSAESFIALETPYGAGNSQLYEGEAAEAMVKQFFDEAIYNFYFFDGEKLQEFFHTKLKQSIYNLSQITLLDNAIDHTKKYQKKLTGLLSKAVPDIEKLQEQKEALESQITSARMLVDTALRDKADANRNVRDLDSNLRGYHPVKNLQEHREELEKEFDRTEEKQKELAKRQSAFIREYIVLLNLYPRVMKSYQYIDEKMKHGDLPPAIDKAKVQHMLDHTEEPCPLCHASLTEDGIAYLRDLLDRIAVSSRTSNFLSEMSTAGDRDRRDTEVQRKTR